MTIKEFAQIAGVSVSTVSKIMNNKDESISTKTREHVLQLAKEYNYVPYASALTSLTKTWIIGVIFRKDSHLKSLSTSVLQTATAHGYSLLLRESDGIETERKNISAMIAAHVDGILWEPVSSDSLDFSCELEQAKIPWFLLGTKDVPLHLDFQAMGYLAAKTLISKHHRDIACISGNTPHEQDFFQGYRKCLFDHHLPFHKDFVFSCTEELPTSILNNHTFSGFVVPDYMEAVKLFQTADTLHYSIPYDFSVVSLQDNSMHYADYPPISAVMVPYSEYGTLLARSLISLIEKHELPAKQELPLSFNRHLSVEKPYHTRQKKVLVVGSINIDNYLTFETLPHTGRTVTSTDSATYPGGKCINQALGIEKLGHHVSVIGRVGDDNDSDLIYQTVNNFHIDSFGLQRSSGCRTGQAYIFLQKNGDSMISILSGANNLVCVEDIRNCEQLFLNASYCLLQTEIPMPAVEEAALIAKNHGLITILKPSSCSRLSDSLLKHIDIIIPNTEELTILRPEEASLEEKARALLSCGVQTVIVTMGADGCRIFEQKQTLHIPAAGFASVDNTGASDAFISALVSYLLYGQDIVTAARIATYAAGLSITRQGVIPSLVDKDTLETYLKANVPELVFS